MILAERNLAWWHWPLLLVSGALVTLSFAPFHLWPLALVGLWIFASAIKRRSTGTIFWIALVFGLGLFSTGASWVYVSIYTYGVPSIPIAGGATAMFALVLAIAFAVPWMFYPLLSRSLGQDLLAFPALWVVMEWSRGFLFTGFPWLFLGYAHTDSLLTSWAPIIGALGISFIIAFTAAAFSDFTQFQKGLFRKVFYVAVCAGFWGAFYELEQYQWTAEMDESMTVRLVQGNIDQAVKWDPAELENNIDAYVDTTGQEWNVDLIVWPEAAIPRAKHQAIELLESIHESTAARNTGFITGIPVYNFEERQFHNSLIALGAADGEYHKQKLVPFGEYIPMKSVVGPVIELVELPLSDMSSGSDDQGLIKVGNFLISPAICYEIAYSDLVSEMTAYANAIVTISNDTWFGSSIGPHQHFQIAQMRALENAKPVIRTTNNGITGLISADGKIISTIPQFERLSMDGVIDPRSGQTPYNEWGEKPLLYAMLGLLGLFFLRNITSRTK